MTDWREWAISSCVAATTVVVLSVIAYTVAFAITSVTDRVTDAHPSLLATGSAGA